MVTLQQSETDGPSEKSREIRVALVLYGGVSLAIYENGVTRSFFDLVKERGIFHLLLTLLDAEAKVDVVAGTSAGGINGLMLAAALESGAEFKETADVWRQHGDFGALMRPVSKADEAISFLKGETYYQEHLTNAFRELTRPVPGYISPGEMDVFITGTDLYGYTRTYWDSIGNTIHDKVHRTLFQLKHRPGRKHLGLNGKPEESRLAVQATILASIARITATFPIAFPPFQIEQVPAEHREQVSEALQRNSGIFEGDRVYVDGGVLDNKPFGPAINAIFYRMPTKPVDRRLFYVEPDPQQFTSIGTHKDETTPNPAFVMWSSLSTIPSHESISEDLNALLEHNVRIGWLKGLKEMAVNICRERKVCVAQDSLETAIYRTVRIDSLAKALLLEVDEVPSAHHDVNPERKQLYETLKQILAGGEEQAESKNEITSYDIDYHLRRAFYFLYHFYREIENEATAESAEHTLATLAIGRVIKALKLVRDALYLLRDEVVAGYLEFVPESRSKQAVGIINLFRGFLDARCDPWQQMRAELEKVRTGPNPLASLAEKEKGPLGSNILSKANQSARNEIGRLKSCGSKTHSSNSDDFGKSILEVIEEALMPALSSCCDAGVIFSQFESEDTIFFPLEFASGIHELDQIQVVRISPRDAQTGLSNLKSASKVTGDDLGHFAAFLRRDWRSNDILWGRLDSICQIVQSFMDKEALKRILNRREQLRELITFDYLKRHLPYCPTHHLAALEKSWKDFLETAKNPQNEKEISVAYEELRKKMIQAGQHDAVNEDLRQVYFDHYFQEISWGTCCRELPSVQCEGPPTPAGSRIKSLFNGCLRLFRIPKSRESVGEDASETAIATAANRWAEESMRHVSDAGEAFRKIGFGSQTVVGDRGAVPPHILSQYATHAYLLLWGVIHQALGRRHGKDNLFGKTRLRLIFRHPARLVHYLIQTMRKGRVLFPVVLTFFFTALTVAGLVGFYYAGYMWLLVILLAIALLALLSWMCPESE